MRRLAVNTFGGDGCDASLSESEPEVVRALLDGVTADTIDYSSLALSLHLLLIDCLGGRELSRYRSAVRSTAAARPMLGQLVAELERAAERVGLTRPPVLFSASRESCSLAEEVIRRYCLEMRASG